MAHMDVFNSDAFNLIELTNSIRRQPYMPQRLGQLGIFTPRPIRTTTFSVEETSHRLHILPTSTRGTPPDERPQDPKRVMRNIDTQRLAESTKITAAEIQGIRAFGRETEVMRAQQLVAERVGSMQSGMGMRADLEITREHHRMGAINGVVLDSDGVAVVHDWYQIYGITPLPFFDFQFSATATDEGVLRKLSNLIVRTMARRAKGNWTASSQIHAFCGDNFYDDMTQNKETRNVYLQQGNVNNLRDDFGAWETFQYGGIVWENYRGTDDGVTIGVPTDECKFVIRNAPGAFQEVLAPHDSFPFVNSNGRREYLIRVADRDRQQWVSFELYSYPTFMCSLPDSLAKGQIIP